MCRFSTFPEDNATRDRRRLADLTRLHHHHHRQSGSRRTCRSDWNCCCERFWRYQTPPKGGSTRRCAGKGRESGKRKSWKEESRGRKRKGRRIIRSRKRRTGPSGQQFVHIANQFLQLESLIFCNFNERVVMLQRHSKIITDGRINRRTDSFIEVRTRI